MSEPSSSLLTKGSTQGSFNSPMGGSYDSYIQQQIEAEYNASRARVGDSVAPEVAPTTKNFQSLSAVKAFDYKKVGVKKRRYVLSWNFSLNEAKANPDVTLAKITRADWASFQNKPANGVSGKAVDQKRVGDLEHIVFKQITVKSIYTSSVDGLAVQMDGIRGNAYGIGSGVRSPFFIHPESSAYGLNEVIHVLDDTRMKMAELRYTKMSREYLKSLAVPLPKNAAMCSVPVECEITEVLAKQKNPLLPKMGEIQVFNGGTHFVLATKLCDKIMDQIMTRRGEVELHSTSLWEWKVGLIRSDGLTWANSDVALKMSKNTGLVGQELLDYRICTQMEIEAEWFNLSDQDWNKNVPK